MNKESTARKLDHVPPFNLNDCKTVLIPVKNLVIKWPGAQRRLKSDAHAKNIAANFDPDKFGVVIVTLPDERGLHHVIDGFNRVQAVSILWGGEEMVPCKVLPVSDPVRAAQVFLGMNAASSRRVVTAIDNFRVGIQAGHSDKIAINKILRDLGYKIDPHNKSDGSISAVGALSTVFNRYGPDVLKHSLELIQATWGLDPNAVSGPIIQGYATFLVTYGNKANWGRVKESIQKRFTPGQFLGAARVLRETERNGLNDAIVTILFNSHNRGLKTGGLKRA